MRNILLLSFLFRKKLMMQFFHQQHNNFLILTSCQTYETVIVRIHKSTNKLISVEIGKYFYNKTHIKEY